MVRSATSSVRKYMQAARHLSAEEGHMYTMEFPFTVKSTAGGIADIGNYTQPNHRVVPQGYMFYCRSIRGRLDYAVANPDVPNAITWQLRVGGGRYNIISGNRFITFAQLLQGVNHTASDITSRIGFPFPSEASVEVELNGNINIATLPAATTWYGEILLIGDIIKK